MALAKPDEPPAAPAFELPVWDGRAQPARSIALAQRRGRWTYLDFWASWCGPCRLSFPWMNSLAAELSSRALDVVAIGLDTKADAAARFLAQNPARFTVLWDPRHATPAAYSVQAMPSSYLIDPQLRLVWSHKGFSAEAAPAMRQAVLARLGAS